MIAEDIKRQALEFADSWLEVLRSQPRYTLDFSWPSTGTLNLILSGLFDRQLTETDEELLIRAASYLAVGAYAAWSVIDPALSVELKREESPKTEIRLSASGGARLKKGERFSVGVLSGLRDVVTGSGPGFERMAVTAEWKTDRVVLFALGLYTGLTPGEGPWNGLSYTERKEELTNVARQLSETSARFYGALHPAEEVGQKPQLYFRNLILPPSGFEEEFFGGRAAFRLTHLLKESNLERTVVREIALNLALSPEPQIAAAGYAAAVAFFGADEPESRLLAVSEGLGERKLIMKHAIALARKALGVLPSIPADLCDEINPEIELLLQVDQQLGLLPLWKVSLQELIEVPALAPLLYWNQGAQARSAIDNHAEGHPLTAALILQGIALDFANGNAERAQRELEDRKRNSTLKSIADPIHKSLRDELIATLAIFRGDFVLAESMLESAAGYPGVPLFKKSAILSLRGKALFVLERHEAALESYERARSYFPSLGAELGRLALLEILKPEEDRAKEVEALARVAPRNVDVFRGLVRFKIRTTS